MKTLNIGLVLVQIEEAHSKKWSTGFEDHPDNHNTFEDRVERAKKFISMFECFRDNVYVDGWHNEFENTFQAWPDQFVLVDKNLKILTKSEYTMDAAIFEDYADIINNL